MRVVVRGRTFACTLEQCIHGRQHRLAALQSVSLQIRELRLHELIEDLALSEQFVYPKLVVGRHRLRCDLRLEEMREPEPLSLRRRVHVFVRNAFDVDPPEMSRDLFQGPLI